MKTTYSIPSGVCRAHDKAPVLIAASLVAIALLALPANAAVISINNPSFENPVLGDGGWTTNNVPQWALWNNNLGVSNPPETNYSGAAGAGTPLGADGTNVLAVWNNGFAYAYQTTPETITANKVYTLTAAVGRRFSLAPHDKAQLYLWRGGAGGGGGGGAKVGGVDVDPTMISPGQFADFSGSYTALAGDGHVGHPLQVLIGAANITSKARYTDFDNVRLTVQDRPAIALNSLSPSVIAGAASADMVALTNSGADPANLFYSVSNDLDSSVAAGTLAGNVMNESVNIAISPSAITVGLHNVTFTATGTDRNNVAAFNNGAWLTSTLTVLDHSSAAFKNASEAAVAAFGPNSLTLDFGTVAEGAGGGYLSAFFDIFNEVTTPGFTAGLDLDEFIAVSGDTGTFSKHAGLDTFSNLAAGSGEGYEFRFDTTALGTFSATYQFRLSDQDLPGASDPSSQFRTLTLQGTVVPEPSAALLLLVALGCGLLVRRRR